MIVHSLHDVLDRCDCPTCRYSRACEQARDALDVMDLATDGMIEAGAELEMKFAHLVADVQKVVVAPHGHDSATLANRSALIDALRTVDALPPCSNAVCTLKMAHSGPCRRLSAEFAPPEPLPSPLTIDVLVNRLESIRAESDVTVMRTRLGGLCSLVEHLRPVNTP